MRPAQLHRRREADRPVRAREVIAAICIAIAILLPFFFDTGSGFIEDSTTALATSSWRSA